MRLQDLALASARVAIASEKASEDLSALLDKWFAKHLVKGIKLPMLRAMHDAGALPAFADCLAAHNEADVIAILRRVDPHRAEILARTRSEMEAHIRELASGRLEPAEKPKPPKKAKAPKAASGKSARNGGVYERSRL
jgi:hypothetical protein